jgi:hypothetical protein
MKSPIDRNHAAAQPPGGPRVSGGAQAAQPPSGLVSFKTSPQFEVFINLDRRACAERRVKRLKRSVWASGHLHGLPRRGHRPAVPWFVTLTYADADVWEADHVSAALERYRRWCQKYGYACQYTWVAEIQPERARRTGKQVVHYHLMAWLPLGVRMPKWDVAVGRRTAFWSHGMTNTERARAGIGYLMKYLSKLGEFTQFPKGLRLYGVGGLSAAARAIRSWLNLPEWAKRSYGVGDLVRKSGRLVVLATGEILDSPYIVSILPGAIVVRATEPIPARFHSGPYSTLQAREVLA